MRPEEVLGNRHIWERYACGTEEGNAVKVNAHYGEKEEEEERTSDERVLVVGEWSETGEDSIAEALSGSILFFIRMRIKTIYRIALALLLHCFCSPCVIFFERQPPSSPAIKTYEVGIKSVQLRRPGLRPRRRQHSFLTHFLLQTSQSQLALLGLHL